MAKPTVFVEEISAGALNASHPAVTLVEALVDGGVEDVEIPVSDGSVGLDSTASSRGRCDLTIPGIEGLVPTGPDSLLAPYGNELRISRGVELSDRIELVRLGIFRIDTAIPSDDGSGISIAVAGLDRSGKIIEDGFETDGQIASGTSAVEAIIAVVSAVDADAVFDFAPYEVPLPLLAFAAGEDRWAFCQGIATSIGAELYCDRQGAYALRPVPVASALPTVATFAEGEGGVLLSADREWDRGPVFNRVIVTGESTSLDTDAPIPRGVATDENHLSPTFYYGRKFGKKPYSWSSPYISLDLQAADAAAGILARTIGAPDRVNLGAVVDPARGPGDVVWIEREALGVAEAHALDSVTIPLAADASMSATTRVTTVSS